VLKGDGDRGIRLRQVDVIQTHGRDHAPMVSPLDRRNHQHRRSILGIEETIPQRSATTGSGTGSLHLGIQSAIHAIPEHTPQGNKIWVSD
jgi:hypothetical protein